MVKSVLAIHDMSGFGRCALTVVIPMLSSFGLQAVPVPTAVLSTHTGGFTDFSFYEMTSFMKETLSHYKSLGLSFDCIYSGYLGNEAQADITAEYIKAFGDGKLVVVDPAFGDDGKLYSNLNRGMVDEMRKLITYADVITPNFTEAAFLLGENPQVEISASEAEEWSKKLSGFGPRYSVITGIHSGDNILTVGYNKNNDCTTVISSQKYPASYPGCGDVFASFVVGCMLSGKLFENAVSEASGFVSKSIEMAAEEKTPVRNGLPFEVFLKKF